MAVSTRSVTRSRAWARLVILVAICTVLDNPATPVREVSLAFVKAPDSAPVGPLQRLGARIDFMFSQLASLTDHVLGRFSEEKAAARRKLYEAKIAALQAIGDAKAEGKRQVKEARQAVRDADREARAIALKKLDQALSDAKSAVAQARQEAEETVKEAKTQIHQAAAKVVD